MMGEKKQHNIDFYFREIGIGKHTIFCHVKVKATALGLVRLTLLSLIVELEQILKDASLSADEKVEKMGEKLSEWSELCAGKKKLEDLLELLSHGEENRKT